MPCYKPLAAYRYAIVGKASKIAFLKSGETIPTKAEYLRIPCGQCTGCRLDHSKMWASRCMHESRLHDHNCFITLTYNDQNLPPDQGLRKGHFQLFMKRLRKYANKPGIKYLHAGEYGETKRPHYHACLFGFDLPDKRFFKENDQGDIIYTSGILDLLWGKGFSTVGDLTWQSAAYTARYSLKKLNGEKANQADPVTGLLHYERTHLHTGEITPVIPEYATQSRNPGLGKGFLEEYMDDIYPWDEVIVDGHAIRPPRYYDNIYEIENEIEMEEIRKRRIKTMEKYVQDNTRARLRTKEAVKIAQTKLLKREL